MQNHQHSHHIYSIYEHSYSPTKGKPTWYLKGSLTHYSICSYTAFKNLRQQTFLFCVIFKIIKGIFKTTKSKIGSYTLYKNKSSLQVTILHHRYRIRNTEIENNQLVPIYSCVLSHEQHIKMSITSTNMSIQIEVFYKFP